MSLSDGTSSSGSQLGLGLVHNLGYIWLDVVEGGKASWKGHHLCLSSHALPFWEGGLPLTVSTVLEKGGVPSRLFVLEKDLSCLSILFRPSPSANSNGEGKLHFCLVNKL